MIFKVSGRVQEGPRSPPDPLKNCLFSGKCLFCQTHFFNCVFESKGQVGAHSYCALLYAVYRKILVLRYSYCICILELEFSNIHSSSNIM